jgi:hypothetical protein
MSNTHDCRMNMPTMLIFTLMVLNLITTPSLAETGKEHRPLEANPLLDQISSMTESIGSKQERVAVIRELALLQAKAGEHAVSRETFKNLIKLVNEMEPPTLLYPNQYDDHLVYWKIWKIEALADIATAEGQAGYSSERDSTFDQALQQADRLPDDDFRKSGALVAIATARVKAGDTTASSAVTQRVIHALEAIKGDGSKYARANENFMAMQIAEIQLQAGDRTSVSASIQKALDATRPTDEMLNLHDIAILQAKMDDPRAAMATLERLARARASTQFKLSSPPAFRNIIDTLKVSEALAEAGNPKAAGDTVKKAIQLIHASTLNDYNQSGVFRELAIAQAKLGEIQAALKTAAQITNESVGGIPLQEIIEAQITAGDLKGALELANRRGDEYQQGKAPLLIDIAVAQAKSGDFSGAVRTIDTVQYSTTTKSKFTAMRAIAEAWVKSGEPEAALNWANTRTSPLQKAYALLGVAEGMLSQKQAASPSSSRG